MNELLYRPKGIHHRPATTPKSGVTRETYDALLKMISVRPYSDAELFALFPEVNPGTVRAAIWYLRHDGKAVRQGNKTLVRNPAMMTAADEAAANYAREAAIRDAPNVEEVYALLGVRAGTLIADIVATVWRALKEVKS